MKFFKIILIGICTICVGIVSIKEHNTYINNSPFIPYVLDSQFFSPQETPIIPNNNEDSQDFIFVPNFEQSAHASSVVDLDSKLMVVFFAGSKEGARDVKIYQSFLYKGGKHWSEPKEILTPQWLSEKSGKYIKKLGNPVIFRDSLNRVHLFVVGVSLGGWSTSKIYQLYFDKDLATLHYVRELQLGLVANLSHLVRTPAVLLENGGFMLPVYHELANKYPLVVFFDAQGNVLFNKRLNDLRGQLQPSIIATSPTQCLEFSRSYKSEYAYLQHCEDKGNIWKEPIKTNLKNYDSSSVLVNIGNEVVLVHNDGFENPILELLELYGEKVYIHARASLSVFWLKDRDNGVFERLLTLDISKDGEVSYPSAIADSKNLYITYTYNRQQIKYAKLRLDSLYELIAQAKEKTKEFQYKEKKQEPFIRIDDFYFAHLGQ